MLRKRFTPKATLNMEVINPYGNTFTIIKLDCIDKYLKEYKEQIKVIVPDINLVTKMIVEALVLFYKYKEDFIDHGLSDLPKEEDMCTAEQQRARENLIDCIIESMKEVDQYDGDLRLICENSQSVSVVNVHKHVVLLSLNIFSGSLH